MKAFSLILFLIFSTPFLGYSQSVPYFSSSPPITEKIDASSFFLKKWTAKMGLPMSSVSSILVDSKGYIWATTFDGVIRFDGFKIKLFSSSSFPEITNDRFFDILEDRHGNIFFISEIKRAYRVDSETGALSVLSAPDNAKPLFVNQMTKTSFGDILFSTKSGIFESKKGNTLASIITSESGEEMFMAFRDQWGTIWFENSQEQLIRFSDGKMNVINVNKPNALRYFDLEEISGNSWLSWNNTIIEFNEFDYTVHNFDAINQENTITHLSYNHTNQSILFGTNNSGFFNWNRKSDQVNKSSIKGSSLIAENGIGRSHTQI